MHRAALLLVTLALLVPGAPARGEEAPPKPVVLAAVVQREVRQGRAFVGSVEATRRGTVDVEAAGLLDDLPVEEGDLVEAGAVLARLRTDTLAIRIRAAEAELRLREQELLELRNGARPQEKEEARARLDEARADEEHAAWRLEAARSLRKDAKLSEEELREGSRAHAAARARRRVAEAALALLVEGPREERIAQASARVAVQAAEVARLEDERKRHVVLAPYKGHVVVRRAEVGAWLAVGDPLVELVGVEDLDVVLPVAEDFIAFLALGAELKVEVDALARRWVDGTIHRILPVADPRTRTVRVKVRLAGGDQTSGVRPGMFARVTLAVGEPRKTVLVPKDAVVLGGAGPHVLVFEEATRQARTVPVRFGVAVDDLIEVVGDVTSGERVVVRGNERLRPGDVLEPMGTR